MANKATNKTALMAKIRNRFGKSVPPKLPKAYELLPNSEASKGTQCFWGKSWEDLNIDLFSKNSDLFYYLRDEHKEYFIGGYIFRSILENNILENYDLFGLSKIGYCKNQFDIFSLSPALPFRNINKKQKEVMLDYFIFCSKICETDEIEIYGILIDRLAGVILSD